MRPLIETFYTALERCDLEGLRATLAPDWEELPVVYPGQGRGPEPYLRVAEGLRASLGELHFEILEIIEAPPKYVVRAMFHGVHRGTFLGRAATGKRLAFAAIDIHEVGGARIIRTWHVEDFASALRQMGTDP